ncbi:proline--tRNA ligase [Spiroplasma endosymbiont of Amphibalanus improvisus]|uniref:proline--tRNA ligase n=1 Tax=Spiroplasma endosymbiont of Amphibalanus improvisus TaxID=3066327 RepID=UPI00313E40CC
MKKNNSITPRSENFVKWYTDVCLQAELFTYGPVKGTIIFKPLGYAIWKNIQNYLNDKFIELGVEEVYFPLLIPKSLINIEKEHFEGFTPELATVTKIGEKKLEEDLCIRPTSETLFSNFFANEIKSYRDLPMKYNQWSNVMRWEKNTRPFLRTSEFLWQEGHTLHTNKIEAQKFTSIILNIYNDLMINILSIYPIVGKKTEKEKFAGAIDTFTIETLMHDGQSLQCATSHYLGQNFSKPYKITFENKDQKLENCYQTSWGTSTRLIGAIIMTHGDDNGLILPFNLAPIQIEIILVKETEVLLKYAKKIMSEGHSEYRIKINDSNKSFGFKIAESEVKGTPIRIEIGPRDLENNSVIVARRDTGEKLVVKLENIWSKLKTIKKDYHDNLFEKNKKNIDNRIQKFENIEQYINALEKNNVLALVPFCNRKSCEEDIKKKTQTNSRCIIKDDNRLTPCFNCKTKTKLLVYFAKAY